jgi:hypothetical protein
MALMADKSEKLPYFHNPRCSMYSIFTYIWLIYGVNVGKYSIHGAYGNGERKPWLCEKLQEGSWRLICPHLTFGGIFTDDFY